MVAFYFTKEEKVREFVDWCLLMGYNSDVTYLGRGIYQTIKVEIPELVKDSEDYVKVSDYYFEIRER